MKSLESEKFTPDDLAELHALPDDAMTKPEEALAGQPYCRALGTCMSIARASAGRTPWGWGWRTWPSSRADPSKPDRVG